MCSLTRQSHGRGRGAGQRRGGRCRAAGLGAGDREGQRGGLGPPGAARAAESGEQQLEAVARVARQHGKAFIISAWAGPLSCVIWGQMDGRGKMEFLSCESAFTVWARAAEVTSVVICGKCHTARDTEGRRRVPTLPNEVLASSHTSCLALGHPRSPGVPESPLDWDQVNLKDPWLMALTGPGTLDTKRDCRPLNCTLQTQGRCTTGVEQRKPPGSVVPAAAEAHADRSRGLPAVRHTV